MADELQRLLKEGDKVAEKGVSKFAGKTFKRKKQKKELRLM